MTQYTEPELTLLKVLDGQAPVRLAAGTVFVRQGDDSDAAYLLIEGVVTVFSETSFGRVTLATVPAPRLIGEVGALASLPRTAALRAETDISVIRIGRALLSEVSRTSPDLLLSVIGHLGSQLVSINKTLALFTNALTALGAHDFDPAILEELRSPPPELADFAAAFHGFATEISNKRRTEQEMAGAAMIQQSLLPPPEVLAPLAGSLDVFAFMRPARQVGGDFYDFFQIDETRFAFAVGDICGKGIPASLFASMVVTVLRTEVREARSVSEAMARANAIICRDNAASLFATTFVGILDVHSGDLDYANCGHNAPLIVTPSGAVRLLPKTGIPLGLFPDRPASEAHARVEVGERLIVFTDGVTEANDLEAREFGDERLGAVVAANRDLPSQTIATSLLQAIDAFSGPAEQSDDITLLVLSRLSPQ